VELCPRDGAPLIDVAAGDRPAPAAVRPGEHEPTLLLGERAPVSVAALSPGTIVDGKYRIDALHGRGGMGIVYRATDLDLERELCIKVLSLRFAHDQRMMRRFRQEARAAARLRHPNVVTVYGFGQMADSSFYIAMEFIEGTSLRQELASRGRLSLEEAAHLFGQIADAVDAAHDAGLVHRDLKPDNIMLERRPGGIAVKVLDFGIAHFLDGGEANVDPLTQPQTVIGTPTYMSPEQARGEPVDSRSDVYSLGVIVYELLSGGVPFTADSALSVAIRHATEQPQPLRTFVPDLPPSVEAAVQAALAKRPDDRPQRATALALRLWEGANRATRPPLVVSTPPAEGRQEANQPPTIAVLPLRSLSSDPENDYFADGLTDELIRALSQLEGVGVLSRTSSARLAEATASLQESGARLGATYVLEGSVRRQAGRVRVWVNLVEVRSDRGLWAETFDRDLEDIFEIQAEVAHRVASALTVSVLPGRRRTAKLEAYDAWLKGRYVFYNQYLATSDPEALRDALRLFDEALELDAGFVDAMLSRAVCCQEMAVEHGVAGAFEEACASMDRALAIDPENAAAHASLGWTALFRRDRQGALESFRTALRINPNTVDAHIGLGVIYRHRGLWDAAESEFERALRLNPLNTSPHVGLIDIAIWRGDISRARQHLARAEEFRLGPVAMRKRAQIEYRAGDYEAAREALRGTSRLTSVARRAAGRALLALIHVRRGDLARADRAMGDEVLDWARGDRDGAETLAQYFALTSRPDEALVWLQRSVEMGNQNYPWIIANPDLAGLHELQGFVELTAELRRHWLGQQEVAG
jgi:serine/threonine protein kinase/Tfp pilus assembly protein PilF